MSLDNIITNIRPSKWLMNLEFMGYQLTLIYRYQYMYDGFDLEMGKFALTI